MVEVDDLSTFLNGASAFSVSLWIRSDTTNQNHAFWNGVDPSGSDESGGRYDSRGRLNGNGGTRNLIKFGIGIDGTNYQYESYGGYRTTGWQHILFTWESGSGARLYVDGILDNLSETSPGACHGHRKYLGSIPLLDRRRGQEHLGRRDRWILRLAIRTDRRSC